MNPWRVVATDDNPKLLEMVVTTLRDAGHCVFAAYDGRSACELALLIPDLDLLVTNTRLGDVSAEALIRRVREARPEVPILHVGQPLDDPASVLGDVVHLSEPFTPAELLAAAKETIGRATGPGAHG